MALLDDARDVLGPKLGKNGKVDELDEIRTFGHIVIDEVQDLTPMQLKMATRRSLSGSMTIVGDIAQATGPLAPNNWDDVLEYLPDRKPARVIGLSVGYRIPQQIMELANQVMAFATPSLRPPRSVRVGDHGPKIVRADLGRRAGGDRGRRRSPRSSTSCRTAASASSPPTGSSAISPQRSPSRRSTTARRHVPASTPGVTLVPVSVVKGLELDGVVVVEPTQIVSDVEQGMRVALRGADPLDATPDRRPRARPARTAPLRPGRRSAPVQPSPV